MSEPTMHKPIAIEILRTLSKGDELSGDRLNGGTFSAMIEKGLVCYDAAEREWKLTDEGRAYLARARADEIGRQASRRVASRARYAARRDGGMRRTAK